jgi:hypothetical protein
MAGLPFFGPRVRSAANNANTTATPSSTEHERDVDTRSTRRARTTTPVGTNEHTNGITDEHMNGITKASTNSNTQSMASAARRAT